MWIYYSSKKLFFLKTLVFYWQWYIVKFGTNFYKHDIDKYLRKFDQPKNMFDLQEVLLGKIGTAIQDMVHELFVYYIKRKIYPEAHLSFE